MSNMVFNDIWKISSRYPVPLQKPVIFNGDKLNLFFNHSSIEKALKLFTKETVTAAMCGHKIQRLVKSTHVPQFDSESKHTA